MKRRCRPDLARVLEDEPQKPSGADPRSPSDRPDFDKRIHTRFDKAFVVRIGSEIYGDCVAIARNISAGGILVEMSYAPPLGTVVTVHFPNPHGDETDEIVIRAEVKHHHYLNYAGGEDPAACRAIGLRFMEFVDVGTQVVFGRLH